MTKKLPVRSIRLLPFCLLLITTVWVSSGTGQTPADTSISVSRGVRDTIRPKQPVELLFGRLPSRRVIQSISTVGTPQLVTTPSPNILQALPGRLAGLNIGFSSGGPGLDGNGMTYNIRGARAQIILVDGVERGYLSIDPEQIESISVLKDALSTVMFGQRSAFGVLSIQTKKGDIGKPRLSFTAQSGFETPAALPKPLPAWQYATLYNEARQNDAGLMPVAPVYPDAQIAAYRNQTDPYIFPDVDWYNTVLKKNARVSKYNFNVQGSGKGFRYFIDLDNMREDGLFRTSDSNKYNTNARLDRYSLRSNVGMDVTSTTFVQLNLAGRFQRYNQPGGSVGSIFTALLNTPQNAYPVFNPNGTYGGTSIYGGNVNIYGQSVSRGYQFQDVRDIAVDLEVTQKLDVLTPGLYLKARASNNNTTYYTTTRQKNFEVFQFANNSYTKYGSTTEQTSAGAANERYRVVYLEGSLGYDRSFGKHAVNVLALANQQSTLAYNTTNLPQNYTAFSGRINYCYDDKYIAEGAVSYSGYNWLSPAARWSTYWAAGLGWNVHNESFIKDNIPVISNFKIRGNYGLTGQVNAGYYSYIQTYYNNFTNTNSNAAYWYGPGSSLDRSTGENAVANPGLRPEKANKLNAGIDLGLWKDKLTLTADYFYNRFFDLVAAPTLVTGVLGSGYPAQNYQKFDYWGNDISLSWHDRIGNFSYFIGGNFSWVQSKVVYNAELPKRYDYQVQKGRPVGLMYGYTATGLFKSYDEINDPSVAVLPAAPKSSLRPGDIRYLDMNNDGVIDVNDQAPIGNGKSTVYYGLNLGFSIHGFDVSALFQGTMNRQSYISGDFMNGFGNNGNYTAYEYNLGRFTGATAATATQPRVWLGANPNNTQTSSFWLKNNDFVRLRNIEIGYSLPEKWTRRIGIPSVRIFSNGLNLFTWAEIHDIRKDMDPESWGGAYPIMKVYNFGLNVKF